ncbi:uncharacterized protein [Asterias amurensis]|uniref:uncharacterized protein isoform X3 n=1 Tax=Asterias amurensis TaxID=7602 RepID=UPI003AB68A0C
MKTAVLAGVLLVLVHAAYSQEVKNVICPGGASQCPDGNTCCKLASGQWGCCPIPNAVCCSDHTHCCPNGYTCDTSQGTCTKGDMTLPWETKNVAQPIKVEAVICPGGTSQCPSGTTCCRLASGQWGCCPFPKAVCCSDHTHCCQNGYICNVAQGTCIKGALTLPWASKNVAQPIEVEAVICPGGTSQCPTGTTCCKLASGAWGCCPFPKAVCCSDHTHCCQNGYICNVAQGTCIKGALTLPWETKNVAQPIEVEAVICPGGTSQCPSGTTCCKLASGAWGCCPFPKAVCCSDHTHCCQNGYICNVAQGTCTKGALTLPWETKNVAQPIEVEAVICPGGTSQCPSGTTCCKLASGAWGCCPFPKAVCCSDHTHCCQNGYICNVAQGTCIKGALTLPWETKNVAQPIEVEAVICPGGTSQCPSGTTCCKLASGAWGCCPFPKAVCCSDHTHCCQNGYICNVAQGTCIKGALTLPWETKNVAQPIEVEAVICPGGTSQCPTGTTCCKLASGAWGCCPFPKAVCCSDHTHCCQNGYICNVAQGTCTKGALTLPWASKNVAQPIKVESVICPGGASECPDGNTCCKLASGQWGCCPIPHAVCCSDHTHCCPNGYTCDTSQGTCTKGDMTLPWETKNVAQPIKVENVICPGSASQCPDGNTCCKLASGQWGCCPIPNAVCCSDHTHCCPNGYTCDTSQGTCTKGDMTLPWETKNVAQPIKVEAVICPGGTSQCPSGTTCCKLASGQWGCCPFPKAVCCSDHTHCCQTGYICNVAQGTCTKGALTLPWETKNVAQPIEAEIVPWSSKTLAFTTTGVDSVVCDSSYQCPDGNTCCKLASGQWGCCPQVKAVCCSDGIHCCPNGYTCDVSAGTCSKSSAPIPWVLKNLALPDGFGDVQCDSTHQCPTGNTCCKLASGQWGCCPLPKATCCSDQQHCCPQDTTCDIPEGKCNKKDEVLTWTTESLALLTLGNIKCDDTHYCPEGNTCCKILTGTWGCCPLPKASCCADMLHCCPNGYNCVSGQCQK